MTYWEVYGLHPILAIWNLSTVYLSPQQVLTAQGKDTGFHRLNSYPSENLGSCLMP